MRIYYAQKVHSPLLFYTGNLLTDASIPSLIQILGNISSTVEVFGIFGNIFNLGELIMISLLLSDNCYTPAAINALVKIFPTCKLIKVMWLWSPGIKFIDPELALAIDLLPNFQFISFVFMKNIGDSKLLALC